MWWLAGKIMERWPGEAKAKAVQTLTPRAMFPKWKHCNHMKIFDKFRPTWTGPAARADDNARHAQNAPLKCGDFAARSAKMRPEPVLPPLAMIDRRPP
jgi:hypothetical protein